MNLDFFDQPVEKAIVKEIRQWSAEALEKPSPYFQNLPPCPYARSAWLNNKVAIIFNKEPSYQVLYSCISRFDDVFDLAIIVDMAFQKDPDVFHDYLEMLNDAISDGVFIDRDIWLMGFHPHDDPNDFIDDSSFMQMVEDEYAMIFVQRLSKVQESADKLAKKGYYDNYLEEYDAEHIFQKRENLYRRLKSWQ